MAWGQRGRKAALKRPGSALPSAAAAAWTLGLSLILLCASCSIGANTHVAGMPALHSVLLLRAPCRFAQTTSIYYARLAPGTYCAVAQDMGWLFFEGPRMVTKFGLGSPELLDGGLYVDKYGEEAQAYFVDLLGFRHLYEAHCHYSIEATDVCKAAPDESSPTLREPAQN